MDLFFWLSVATLVVALGFWLYELGHPWVEDIDQSHPDALTERERRGVR